jgi:hypothetical protein
VAFGIWGSASIVRWVARSRKRIQNTDAFLETVAQLRPDQLEDWDNSQLRAHSGITKFLAAVSQQLEEKEAKLAYYAGLEGQILRLRKSLDGGVREELLSSHDHPALDKLGQSVLGVFDAEAKTRGEIEQLKGKLAESGASLRDSIVAAARFNNLALDQVNLQVASLEKLSANLEEIERLQTACVEKQDGQLASLAGKVKEIAPVLVDPKHQQGLGEVAGKLKKLGESGGKLAIRTAAELGKVDPHNQALLGTVEALQSLFADFRATATRVEELALSWREYQQVVARSWQDLEPVLTASAPSQQSEPVWHEQSARLADLRASSQSGLEVLGSLAPGFNEQFERLAELGLICSKLTGVPLESSQLAASAAPAMPPSQPAQAEDSRLQVARVTPSAKPEDSAGRSQAGRVAPGQTALPMQQERVYDLSEFDAVALDPEAPAGVAAKDRIYDLSEFGAVALS